MPLLTYFFGIGSVLLCLMFACDAYLPKPPPRAEHDIDRTPIRVEARGPEFAIPFAPDETAAAEADIKPAAPVRQALAKFEAERKARPRHRRPVDENEREPPKTRVADQAANDWSNNNWNNWSNNGWSNSNWSGNWSGNGSNR